jgi:hypothetical protein
MAPSDGDQYPEIMCLNTNVVLAFSGHRRLGIN